MCVGCPECALSTSHGEPTTSRGQCSLPEEQKGKTNSPWWQSRCMGMALQRLHGIASQHHPTVSPCSQAGSSVQAASGGVHLAAQPSLIAIKMSASCFVSQNRRIFLTWVFFPIFFFSQASLKVSSSPPPSLRRLLPM